VSDEEREGTRERLAALGEIAAEIAHELRNVLQIVSSSAYVARQDIERGDATAAPDCTKDFVVFPTNLPGTKGGQASIIAYDKLYSGTPATSAFCGSSSPSVYWSYNTNFNASGGKTTGTIATSPILSADGSKVAFIENNGGSGAVLHLLKWNAGDGGAINTAANPNIATAWTSCPATGSCMISITFANANADTGSSPFYDYTHDALYAGDDVGVLHKFVNVFGITGATPSESTSGWPVARSHTMLDARWLAMPTASTVPPSRRAA